MSNQLIQTQRKDKISKALSFPLGAQTISEMVCPVPFPEDTYILFCARPTSFASQFQTILNNQSPYLLLECRAWIRGNMLNDFRGSAWEISLYPVLSELRAEAGAALTLCGLPQAKELLARGKPVWPLVDKPLLPYVGFYFDPMEKTTKQR